MTLNSCGYHVEEVEASYHKMTGYFLKDKKETFIPLENIYRTINQQNGDPLCIGRHRISNKDKNEVTYIAYLADEPDETIKAMFINQVKDKINANFDKAESKYLEAKAEYTSLIAQKEMFSHLFEKYEQPEVETLEFL